MQQFKRGRQIHQGKLSVLALALSSALAAMTSAHADTTISSGQTETITQNWGSGNFTIAAGGTINTAYIGIDASGTLGTLANSGFIHSGIDGVSNSGSIARIVNSGSVDGLNTGVYNYGGTIDNITNDGTINADFNAIFNRNDATIATVVNNGIISGGSFGIYNANANIGSISNTGTISNGGGILNAGSSTIGGLANSGTISNILNYAMIGGGSAAISNSGTIDSVNNSGTISGTSFGITNSHTIGSIANSQAIFGHDAGINNNGGSIGSITNDAGATIAGDNYGIYNYASSSIGGISNSGVISADTGLDNDGSLLSLGNSGTITGVYGIYNSGTIWTLTNSGLIQGSSNAIFTSGAISSFINTGTIAGTIENTSSTVLAIAGGTGTIVGTLTGGSGGITASDIGKIVSRGDLNLSGNQLLNDNISINSGSGTVANAGNLQVNNILTITGSYDQGAGASLIIGVSSLADLSHGNILDSGYGRLVVSGNVSLDHSGVILSPSGYSFAQGQRYVVVASQGSISAVDATYAATGYSYAVTGTVSTDTSDASYSDLILTLGGAAGSRPVNNASNGNAARMLGALFNYSGTDAALLDVFNPAAALNTADSANRAGAQLSPAATANAVISASSAAFTAVQAAASSRLDTLRSAEASASSGVSSGESSLAPALWGRFFGGQANQGQRDGISGYHASYGGFMLGSDVQIHPDWRVGGLFSLAKTNLGNDGDNSASSASVNAYGLSAYAGYDGHPWYLDLTAGVARQLYSTRRAINYAGFSGTAYGDFKGLLYTTTAQAGYPLQVAGLTLTPLAGLSYSALRQDGYSESGGNGAALSINGSSHISFKGQLGAKLERSFMSSYGELRPFVQLGWNHEFRDTPLTTTGVFAADNTGTTAFATAGPNPQRNTAQLSLGAALLRTGNLTLSARYTLEGARGYTAQTGDVTLRWQY